MGRFLLILSISYSLIIFTANVPEAVEPELSESSMSIYSDDDKVGYSRTSIKKHGGNTFIEEFSELRVKLLGKKQTVKTEAEYILSGFALDSFKYKMDSETGKLSAWGGVKDGRLNIKLKTVSGYTDITLNAQEDFTVFSILPKFLSQKPMAVGQEYRVNLFEPSAVLLGTSSKDLVSVNSVEALEEIETPDSGKIETFRVVTEFMGANYTSWITPGGDVLKQSLPPGLTASQDSDPSKDPGKLKSFNIMEKTSIFSDKKVKNPRGAKYLRAEMSGIENLEGFNLNGGGRQTFNDGVVEIRVEETTSAGYEIPYSDQIEGEYLLPSYLIQSGDENIAALANNIIGDESDPLKAASKINTWVFENIKKEGTVSLPNALDVLRTRKGDCNEHAALFAALSRAAGIPTKIVMGTIYEDGRFYYHAWNEVFLGRWVAVDPTYGQLPADATHIKLLEGDLKKSGEIMKVVGKIKIEVLESS